MKELIGARVSHVFLNDDDTLIKFVTDKGDFIYRAEGDCCSETWFTSIEGLSSLLGNVVLNVVAREDDGGRAVPDTDIRQECDVFYGFDLMCHAGLRTCIEFRNSSNGYYGGWCELVGEPSSDMVWREITEDKI